MKYRLAFQEGIKETPRLSHLQVNYHGSSSPPRLHFPSKNATSGAVERVSISRQKGIRDP